MKHFKFEGKDLTVIMEGLNKPWFIAKEVCDILGLDNVGQAVKGLDPDEKNVISITIDDRKGRGSPKRTIISEPGLYKLIQKSRKPEAKRFDRWVRHEVLPSIRKTGSYSVAPQIETEIRPIPSNYIEALEAHLDSEKQMVIARADRDVARRTVAATNQKMEVMIPKAKTYDQIHAATGLVRMTDAAKIMGIKPHEFTNKCRDHKICYDALNKLIPFQPYIDKGWFQVVLRPAKGDPTHTYRQTFVTPKGVHKLKELFNPDDGPGPRQKRLFG